MTTSPTGDGVIDGLADAPGQPSAGFARLTRDSALYAAGAAAGKVIGFVMLPVLTRLMTPDALGRFDLLSTVGSATISILSLGLDLAAIRIAVDRNEPEAFRRSIVVTWLAIHAGAAAIASLGLLGAGVAVGLLLDEPRLTQSLPILGLVIVAGTCNVVGLGMLRIERRAMAHAATVAVILLVNALLAVGLLVTWNSDERAPLLALGVSWAFGSVLSFAIVGRRVWVRPTRRAASTLLAMGLPLAPAIVALWLSEIMNRSILVALAGESELGFLSVALRFASVAGLVVVGFQLAWQPHAFSLGTSPEALKEIAGDAKRILLVTSLTVAAVGLVGPELVAVWSGPQFAGALPALGSALVGVLALAAYLVASMPSSLVRRTSDLGIGGGAGFAVGIGVNFLVASAWGAVGTAAAIAAGQFVAAAIVWRLGVRSLRFPQVWSRGAPTLLLAGSVAVIATAVPGLPLGLRLALLVLITVLAVATGGRMKWIRAWHRAGR